MKLTIRHNLFKLLIISLPMEYICTLISWMIRHKALQCITARSRCPNSVSIQAHGKIKSMSSFFHLENDSLSISLRSSTSLFTTTEMENH
jgi:hypothetical protein